MIIYVGVKNVRQSNENQWMSFVERIYKAKLKLTFLARLASWILSCCKLVFIISSISDSF